jgi:cbb3-type cytochrome oxidase maturation protein
MDILYLLIPLSTVLVLLILGLFAWALYGGQFDELDGEGARILDADLPPVEPDQPPLTGLSEQFATPAPGAH